jgi:hypothetical protein
MQHVYGLCVTCDTQTAVPLPPFGGAAPSVPGTLLTPLVAGGGSTLSLSRSPRAEARARDAAGRGQYADVRAASASGCMRARVCDRTLCSWR